VNICNLYRDLMPLSVDGVLSSDTRLALKEHLRSCESCRAYLARIRRTRSPLIPTPPPRRGDYAMLKERLRRHRRSCNRLAGGLMLGAVGLQAVTLALLLRKSR